MSLTQVRDQAIRLAEFATGTLRGFALAHGIAYTEKDITDLRATGANVVRIPLHWTGGLRPDLAEVKRLLVLCARYDIRAIVVMCPISLDYWSDPQVQQDLVSVWQWTAGQLRMYPALQAYDIINEPVGTQYNIQQKTQWMSIAQVLVTALRAADTKTPIMVEPCWWGLPSSFWQTLPVKVSGLVYSFHFYEPHEYTHQTLDGNPTPIPLPPDTVFSDVLEAHNFAALHRVPMFIGEFSVIRWAPGRETWIQRAIDLFVSQGWGWTYHVWRDWEGWDCEIPSTVPAWSGTAQDRSSTSPVLLALKQKMKT